MLLRCGDAPESEDDGSLIFELLFKDGDDGKFSREDTGTPSLDDLSTDGEGGTKPFEDSMNSGDGGTTSYGDLLIGGDDVIHSLEDVMIGGDVGSTSREDLLLGDEDEVKTKFPSVDGSTWLLSTDDSLPDVDPDVVFSDEDHLFADGVGMLSYDEGRAPSFTNDPS